ncbi:hypothetical protein GGR28_002921 [Lewinella aquimaris]|uniref:Uncharacterized protein n=1 Tax=Neolewinella aquimaris TaxID=1835722 RepID=A0A840E535_9BACT|nr:hypothetical protein [Neolewinella aquimaris]MBB4080291.1 hypothetical protein [Neolewinella aquimaris]
MRNFSLRAAALLPLSLLVFSCEQEPVVEVMEVATTAPRFMDFPTAKGGSATLGKNADGPAVTVAMAEYITGADSDEMGNTILFNNRGNKQLDFDFVPGQSLDGSDAISYYIDESRPSDDVPVEVSTDAIVRSMDTWDNVDCSDLDLFRVPTDGRATGFYAAAYGFGGSFNYVADVVHNGWLPAAFFDRLAPNGSRSILGVTFTLVFINPDGSFQDADNDGKGDVAWREIYYNDRFNWSNGSGIDIETVSLHEAGHGLSQAHFGKGFRKKDGSVQFSPRAVMNATYSGLQTEVDGTDNAGHCSNWANWPNN